jgi:hypothetical protein
VVTTSLPDEYSLMLNRSLAIATNTLSPMSRGVGDGLYLGLSGHGGNAWEGSLNVPLQDFRGVANPIRYPQHVSVGGETGAPGTKGSTLAGVAGVLAAQTGLEQGL